MAAVTLGPSDDKLSTPLWLFTLALHSAPDNTVHELSGAGQPAVNPMAVRWDQMTTADF